MREFNFILLILSIAAFFLPERSAAQHIVREGDEKGETRNRTIVVPYAFSSETLGFGLGVGGSFGPKSQPQTTYYGTAYGTDNASWLFMLGGWNVQIPGTKRLSLRPFASVDRNSEMRIFIDGASIFPGERAGSNESSANNYIERDAYKITLDLPIRYTLPWGHFRDAAIHTYITRNGILEENPSGAESFNPLQSGQSTLIFRPFYRQINDRTDEGETLYFELGYEHDNRDFVPNPHRGYKLKTSVKYDPDWLESSREWAVIEGELDTFIPLPETAWCRQQTIAFAGWASYTPTYDVDSPDYNGKPPYFAGPSLGGLWRLRGYPSYRFHDKAAIHYTAEYRVMPEWQPFSSIEALDPLMIRWWQIVGLAKCGRVAPSWNIKTLHSDMKYDVGVGLRGMFNSGIGRLDLVVSEESVSFTAMFGQAF